MNPTAKEREHLGVSKTEFRHQICPNVISNSDINPCVSVIIPVFNEAATIARIVGMVLQQRCVNELIAVDDCSTDGSWNILQCLAGENPKVKVFRHEVNQGKGAVLRTGISKATSPVVLIQDADLEYDPSEYDALISPILSQKADVVFGSRFAGGGAHRVLYYWHSLGNKFLTILSNIATDLNLTDMETCYKAFRREVIQSIKIEEDRFGFEPEVTAKVAKLGCRFYEVPISYNGRTYAEGKKINWRDGFRALWCILKYNFLRRSVENLGTDLDSPKPSTSIGRRNTEVLKSYLAGK